MPRNLISTTAIGCLAVAGCAGNRPAKPSPVPVPPADATLISEINAGSLLIRMDKPGYALVYLVGQNGGLIQLSPESTRPLKLPAGTAAVALPQPSREPPSARLAGTRSEPWPSAAACGAAPPQLCSKDNRSDWIVITPDRAPTAIRGIDAIASYVVIITNTLPDLRQAYPDYPVSLKPAEVVQSLVRKVSTLVPVRRWAVVAPR